MSKKKILICGSGGFIGSCFVRKLLHTKSHAYDVISVDLCKSAGTLNSVYANKGHKFHIADIADKHVMNVIFESERPDWVVNLAAETFVDSAIENPEPFVHSNVLGT